MLRQRLRPRALLHRLEIVPILLVAQAVLAAKARLIQVQTLKRWGAGRGEQQCC